MKRVVASAVLRDGAGRTLFARRVDSGLYTPPGGKVDDNELIEEALVRELREETGLVAEKWELIGYEDMPSKVVFFYDVYAWSGELVNMEPEKHRDWEWLRWFPLDAEAVEGIAKFKRRLIGVLESMVIRRRAG